MQMKKFVAATTREAMRKMKDELGCEAYVMSNRNTAKGVEILAMSGSAIDALARSVGAAPQSLPVLNSAPGPRSDARPEARPGLRPEPRHPPAHAAQGLAGAGMSPFKTLRDIAVHLPPSAAAAAAPSAVPPPASAAQMPAPVSIDTAAIGFQPGTDPGTVYGTAQQHLLDEFKAMKALLERQLASLAWRDSVQRRPLAADLWRELTSAGYSPAVARSLAGRLPDAFTGVQARQWMQDVLVHNLHCAAPGQDIVSVGGVYALVGPTGVGKTTTTAKLAARCVVKYGAAALGLVTTDGYRIGAFDQLAIYAKILGVPVHATQSAAELGAVLAGLKGKRLVLIDTAGLGQRDARLEPQLALLDQVPVRRVLLLNAAAQAETLDDVVQAYAAPRAAQPAAVILTKLDEAVKLAPALDTCTRHHLEIHYVTGGQRVPEDIHPANGQALAHRALRVAASPVFALHDDELPAAAWDGGTGGAGGAGAAGKVPANVAVPRVSTTPAAGANLTGSVQRSGEASWR